MTSNIDYKLLKNHDDGQESQVRVGPHVSSNKPFYIWRGINFLMFIFFFLAAAVQLNDEDPHVWIPAYVAPALFSLAITIYPQVTTSSWWRNLVVFHMALCISGAIYLTCVVFELLSKNIANPLIHEEGRELGGLLIIVAWLGLCRFSKLGKHDDSKTGSVNALLLGSAVMGLMPLAFWGLCFIDQLTHKLGHCRDMFV